LHFNFENFKANYLGKAQPGSTEQEYKRMLPPGELVYFFSNSDQRFFIANDQHQKPSPDGDVVPDVPIYDGSLYEANLLFSNYSHIAK